MKTVTPRLFFVLLAILPLAAMAGEPIDQHWNVAAGATLSIDNAAGKIEVQGWGRNEVHLSGKLGNSVKELEVNENDTGLQLAVINRGERNIDESVLVLNIPAGATLEATGVSADIKVTAMENGKLTAESVSGDVDVEAASHWVSLESVSGDVNFRGSTTRISAETVSGDMTLSGITGELEATTVSGDMVLSAGEVDSCKLETVSGDIELTASVSTHGRLSADSMSGDVSIRLPATQQGGFKAQSFSGRISTDFGAIERTKHGPGSHLKYSAGSNNAEIRVESFSGDISFEQE